MIGGVREQVAVAGMVVMHVADDYVADGRRIDPDREQPVAWRSQEFPLALFRHCLVEAGIEDQGAVLADDRPDEIIERHRAVVMRVRREKTLAREAVVVGIAHGIDFVGVGGHRALLTGIAALIGRPRRACQPEP